MFNLIQIGFIAYHYDICFVLISFQTPKRTSTSFQGYLHNLEGSKKGLTWKTPVSSVAEF